MLAISSAKNEIEIEMENTMSDAVDFPDFSAGINLLDSIDFDDLFAGIGGGDFLPDLEMDEINPAGGEDSPSLTPELDPRVEISDIGSGPSSPPCEKRKKSMATSKNTHGKRKVKVDWTPELHKRFVQAVEQLGVDKAVPSRILELMGIDCLTRHNIASHLQKYRSHRKHLLAREAEAASWSQRRQMYGGGGGGPAVKRGDPWITPTMGLPMPHFRPPLHVWGHPSVDQSMMPMWQKHLTPLPPPPPTHAWPPPPPENPYWIPHHNVPMPGMPCFPPTRFPTVTQGQTTITQPPSDMHPSKESVDAAIGDVLTKPWLPLPLGLKPPSVDSVVVELQRQGIPKIPPTCGA